MQQKKKALGRGLEALLPPKVQPAPQPPPESPVEAPAPSSDPKSSRMMAITAIRRNENQPRQYFDEEALQALAESLKLHGFIQPIAVMPRENDFVIVAGERRFRAAQLAGIREVPVIVMEPLSDQDLLAFALVENLQRENLNPLEEARAYKSLGTAFGLSAEAISRQVGKSRSAIANALRLLKMPTDMQEDLLAERITAGHARAIMSLDVGRDQYALRDMILSEGLSVRQAELEAQHIFSRREGKSGSGNSPARKPTQPDHIRQLREQLTDALLCRVNVQTRDGQSGKIEILFENLDELQGVLDKLGVQM